MGNNHLIQNLLAYLKFQRAHWGGKITCPERPHFESQECTDVFEEMLNRSNVYLEYGSGGSSVLAASLGKKTFSVDSDKLFQNKVRETLSRCGIDRDAPITLIYADIGLTREWGVPVFTKPTLTRLKKWQSYTSAPWDLMRKEGLVPDLILIDGRFRAACALDSLKNLGENDNARIIVDDYKGRDWYQVIEQFGELTGTIGRMAIFKPKPFDSEEIAKAMAVYSGDWR